MEKISENILIYKFDVGLMPKLDMPSKTTIVELGGNRALVISPGPFSEREAESIKANYSEIYAVAPNLFHHMYLKTFNEQFPEVKIFGDKALLKKQPWLEGKLNGLSELKNRLQGEVDIFEVQGIPSFNESAFYVKASKALVVTDLLFNIRKPIPFGLGLILAMTGTKNTLAQSRVIKINIKNKTAYLKSISEILKNEIQLIVMAHGNLIDHKVEIKKARDILLHNLPNT